jgi:ppGpp synthetase/RelA/SpoT-type nucleotidyltranferase
MAGLIKEVEEFRKKNEPHYKKLLHAVRDVLETVRTDDSRMRGKIRDIYGRAETQSGNDFKSSIKIANKLAIWRLKDRKIQIKDIHDIIGLTVVVYYADHIDELIEIVLPALAHEKLYPFKGPGENPSYHRDFGYHATHLIVVSKHPTHFGLKIEVQFKTMLHDAWGAKTHDLTYKPKGAVNPKIKRLMESLGDSLQAIEVQSENLRAVIAEQSVVDADRRRLVITQMAEGLQRRFPEGKAAGARLIFERIKNDIDHLSRCRLEDERLVVVTKDIEANNESIADIGAAKLLLYVWLACIRLSDDHNHMARMNINEVQRNLEKKNKGLAYHWAAMLHYFIRDFDSAIDLSRKGWRSSGVSAGTRKKLANNLCYFLIESCIEAPPDQEKRKREATALREELRSHKVPKELRPAANFTRGFYDVIFGETEEQILGGVSQCESAYRKEHRNPDAFVSLLIQDCRRAGWRRILYLDTLKKTDAASRE